jgi:hypothetical protein
LDPLSIWTERSGIVTSVQRIFPTNTCHTIKEEFFGKREREKDGSAGSTRYGMDRDIVLDHCGRDTGEGRPLWLVVL